MVNRLIEMLAKTDPETLKKNVEAAKKFAQSDKGKDLISTISGKSPEQTAQSLDSFDPSSLNITADKKNDILKQLTANPELAKKIEQLLK